ncbi:MAG: S9 family peptidase [bacterium]|nr:S9 family peptidase [bacterium]
MRKRIVTLSVALFVVAFIFTGYAPAESKQPMTPESLYRVKNLTDPQVSPDGKWVAYTVSVPDLEDNRFIADIWLVPVSGGQPKPLTSGGGNSSPRWSPDGKQIAFISSRNGTDNIFLLDTSGGEARQLTHSETGLGSPVWSGNGKHILCRSRVLPKGKTNIENWTQDQLPHSRARTIDRLLFRQWNRWLGDERNHLFLVDAATGGMTDVTPADADVPPVSLSSSHDYDISPDGKEICFTRNDDPMLAVSTNHDLFLLDLGTMKETKLTANKALDREPHYSPDGRYIAYTAMAKVGYEYDRKVLTIYDREAKTHTPLTGKLDCSASGIRWEPSGKSIYFTCYEQGLSVVYRVDLKGNFKRITKDGFNINVGLTPAGDRLVFLRSYNHMPHEIFSMNLKGKPKGMKVKQLTHTNDGFLADFELPKLEEFRFKGAEGDTVHGFILKPPGFDATKKYPVVLTIHGGPQNMWADRFMTRWLTFQLISSPGYVGVFLNPRGSSGYGSTFREQVSKDYGGRCFTDLMKGMDYVLANYDFVDKDKQAAVGGSFGGYSVNWLMGKTQRFKCIVSHAGFYSLESFYTTTEELWYPAWDMGETPWDEPGIYAKWSPKQHVKKFNTPTLITHGENDFRVNFSEGLQMFTALQRRGVPSRLVVFPDEGHVVSSPQNNVRWWKEIHRWLETYLE